MSMFDDDEGTVNLDVSGAGKSSPASASIDEVVDQITDDAKRRAKGNANPYSEDSPYAEQALLEAKEDDLLGIKRNAAWVQKRSLQLWGEDNLRSAESARKVQWIPREEAEKLTARKVEEARTKERERFDEKVAAFYPSARKGDLDSPDIIRDRLEREYSKKRIRDLKVLWFNGIVFLSTSFMACGFNLLPDPWRFLIITCPLVLLLFLSRHFLRVKKETEEERIKERVRDELIEEVVELRRIVGNLNNGPTGLSGVPLTGSTGPIGVTGVAGPCIAATGPTGQSNPFTTLEEPDPVQVGDGFTQLSYGPSGLEENKESPITETAILSSLSWDEVVRSNEEYHQKQKNKKPWSLRVREWLVGTYTRKPNP